MRKEAIRELEESIHVMHEIDPSEFSSKKAPAVTIYLPIHNTGREGRRTEEDRIEFKNLAKRARTDLQKQWGKAAVSTIVDKLEYIADNGDLDFWRNKANGLAFMVDADNCYVYSMDGSPSPLVEVGDQFDMAPILGEAQRSQKLHYKLLLLDSDFFAILQGDENGVHYMELPEGVKHFFAETYQEFDGDTSPLDYYSLEDHFSPYHSHRSRKEVTKEETKKFFHYVNKVLEDKILRDNVEPVILVTTPEHASAFRKICSVELYPDGIQKDPCSMSGEELRKKAIEMLE